MKIKTLINRLKYRLKTVNLIKYIKRHYNDFTEDNVFAIVDDKEYKPVVSFALYKNKDGVITLYNNIFNEQELYPLDNPEYELSKGYLDLRFDTNKIIELSRDEWDKFLKNSIKNSMEKYTPNEIIKLTEVVKQNQGKIVIIDNKECIYLGIGVSDEDYYNVMGYIDEQGEIKIWRSATYIGFDIKEEGNSELTEIFNSRKDEVINKINSCTAEYFIGLF